MMKLILIALLVVFMLGFSSILNQTATIEKYIPLQEKNEPTDSAAEQQGGTLTPLKKTAVQVAEMVKTAVPDTIPLRVISEPKSSVLTRQGIIVFTNAERIKNSLAILSENQKLDQAAEIKVDDMFAKQYFAHESPSGVMVGDNVERVSYEFIVVGENLALGNFENDAELVQGWMNSPGHRANILNSRFQEIGSAAKKGLYEGKTAWLAVQIFATPRSACPEPDQKMAEQIALNKEKISESKAALLTLQSEIEQMSKSDKEAYNARVNTYNALVAEYNALVNETQTLVETYNAEVRAFNACAAG